METRSEGGDEAILPDAGASDLPQPLLQAIGASVRLLDLAGMEVDDVSAVGGVEWAGRLPHEDRARARKAVADAAAGQSTRFVAQFPTADGTLRWWSVTVAPVRNEGGGVGRILALSYDVSAYKEREAALERAVEESQRAAMALAERLDAETRRVTEAQRRASHSEKLRLLGGFVGYVVHDINNVLAVMRSAEQAMRRQERETRVAGMLDEVDKAIDRGRRLVRRLLDFARSEETEAEIFSPRDLIERDADLVRHLAGPSASVSFDLRADDWPILAEPARLQSVLFNLVSNAREALLEKTGSIRVAVRNCPAKDRPEGLPAADYVVVSVADDGAGMTAEVLQRAGEPYFTTKRPGEGTGLGLASAFEFAAAVEGRAYVESAPGAGATVSLYLARALKLN